MTIINSIANCNLGQEIKTTYIMYFFHIFLPQGMSVYPPNTYSSFLITVTVSRFPSQLLWKILAAQP